MTSDREVMAEALWVEQNHGDKGPVFVARQIGALALRGDEAGIARWQRIARALASLREGTGQ